VKITFQIDPQYDYDMVLHMLRGKDWQNRAKRMGLDFSLVEKINQATGTDMCILLQTNPAQKGSYI